ncbi:hypothetical protein CVS40_12957 [Lucilia cuprina]|nr:hypothetical protein CVS40_12957 [Lucilia cuprina]
MSDLIAVLVKKYSDVCWHELVKATLIFIQIFNRRRPGEIERLTINNYLSKEVITDNVGKEILENMSQESVAFAKQFERLTLRGKLGRTVSVLFKSSKHKGYRHNSQK